MAKRKPVEVKRVAIAPLVSPVTREALRRFAAHAGVSQGEIVDDAVAGIVQGYADTPLEDGEKYGRPEPVDLAMVEKATTRVPVRIGTERGTPVPGVGTVTVDKLPEHSTTGARVTFSDEKRPRRQTFKRGIRPKGDTKR